MDRTGLYAFNTITQVIPKALSEAILFKATGPWPYVKVWVFVPQRTYAHVASLWRTEQLLAITKVRLFYSATTPEMSVKKGTMF